MSDTSIHEAVPAPAALDLPHEQIDGWPGRALAEAHLGPDASTVVRVAAAKVERDPESMLLAALVALLGRYTHEEQLTLGVRSAGWRTVSVPLDAGGARGLLDVANALEGQCAAPPDIRPVGATAEAAVAEGAAAADPPGEGWTGSTPELSLRATITGDDVTVDCRFDGSRLSAGMIDRLLGHFGVLLPAACADPFRPVAELPLLTEGERQLLGDWNGTAAEFAADVAFPSLFEDTARRHPQRVAVRCGGDDLTYEALDGRANQLAHHLRSLGVGPDVTVGVCLHRSLEMVVAVLGVMKAGGAYVPLDPTYPVDRLVYMLGDSGAPVLVTTQDLVALFGADRPATVLLDADAAEVAARPHHQLDGGAGPENLAYVIYTSGSTGRPKGVEIPHRALVNLLTSMARTPGITPDDVLLGVTTLSFDICGLELYLPLLAGAELVLAPTDDAARPEQLMRLLARSGATVMQATPATWKLLVQAGWSGDRRLKMLCGGEALSPVLAAALLERGGELWNLYGPTETTIWSSTHRVQRVDGPVPIGRPIANTQLHVLDDARQPTPVGVPGELYIGGAGLARGYRNRPDLTAERFVPHPASDDPGARLYRTGDLVRYREDGVVEYLGRLDNQVKVRGYRIELGEIEAALCSHPAVADAVVAARDNREGEGRLVAYVVPAEPGRPPSGSALRRALGEMLPTFMVPAQIVTLEALPLTPNGKVDRKALPTPPSPTDRQRVAPRDEIERRVVTVWEEVLGIRPIGVTDEFWDLGVDSLTAARLFARLEREFHQRLPLGSLFEAPTVESLASVLRDGSRSARWSSLVAMHAGGSGSPLFLVHGGAGTILHLHGLASLLDSETPVYGLQARGLYGHRPPHRTIPQMAAAYIEEIREVQPTGPYHLAGHCFGGVIAFEMAQQLRTAGASVAPVVMIATLTRAYDDQLQPLREQRRRVRRMRSETARAERPDRPANPPSARGDPLRSIARPVRRAVRSQVRRAALRATLTLRVPVPATVRDVYFHQSHDRAYRSYEPRRYPGRVLVFVGEGVYGRPDLGWRDVADDVEVIELPAPEGRGRDLYEEPAVMLLADHLCRYLRAPV